MQPYYLNQICFGDNLSNFHFNALISLFSHLTTLNSYLELELE